MKAGSVSALRLGTAADALFLLTDKESINSPFFLHIVWLKLTTAFFHTGG